MSDNRHHPVECPAIYTTAGRSKTMPCRDELTCSTAQSSEPLARPQCQRRAWTVACRSSTSWLQRPELDSPHGRTFHDLRGTTGRQCAGPVNLYDQNDLRTPRLTPRGNPERSNVTIQRLSHRGVAFTLRPDGEGYRWAVKPTGAKTPLTGHITGLSAYRRSHTAAIAAIDLWLTNHEGA